MNLFKARKIYIIQYLYFSLKNLKNCLIIYLFISCFVNRSKPVGTVQQETGSRARQKKGKNLVEVKKLSSENHDFY